RRWPFWNGRVSGRRPGGRMKYHSRGKNARGISPGVCNLGGRAPDLQGALDALDAEAFDDVAGADVFVVLEGHAAFLAHRHFLDPVLEALERLELAFVDNDVVAEQAHTGTALDDALGDTAAGDLADLGDLEDFEDLGVADEGLAALGLEEA